MHAPMKDAVTERNARLRAGALRFAAAEKSDPFALRRALSHIASGICGPTDEGKDGHYDADEVAEEAVTVTGSTFTKPAYRNIGRP